MMRTLLITMASAALTGCIIANAFYEKKQFYPSVIFITRSNSSMSIIYLQAFICVLLISKLFRFIFFGELRATERENLIERSWHAISETCLAFTVFRDDLNPKFVALFTLLLFLKCFHWLAEDRVDFMERSPNISLLFHIRITSLLIILGLLDIMFIMFAYYSTMLKGASVQLVFGFEYAILLAVIITIITKYSLHRYDLEQRDIPWENKVRVYLLYFELLVGLYKVVLYLSFIVVMARIHSFPLFAVRPMYLSVKAFQKALNDVILSRRAIRNMNELYPNATPEELASVDNVCIICREEMVGNGSAKKLPCNHIFHVSCLRSWFQRQQTCPTCRMNILSPTVNNQPANNNNQQQQIVPNQQPQQQANSNNNNQQPPPAGQQQPNQQQPNAANHINAGNFRFILNNLNVVDNLADYMLQDRQQRAPAAANQQRNTTDTSQITNHPQQDQRTRLTANATLLPPLMGFSFMPFLPFPPINPQGTNITNTTSTNLSQPSEEELRNVEGNERNALEARIRLLQNLRTSIDAIVLQFQQYNQLIVRSQQQAAEPSSNVERPSSDQTSSTTTTNDNSSGEDKKKINISEDVNKKESEKEENNSKASEKKSDNERASTSEIKDEPIMSLNKDDDKSNLIERIEDEKVYKEEQLIRQIRLRRFNNNQSNESDASSVKNQESKD